MYYIYMLLCEAFLMQLEKLGINVPIHLCFNNTKYLYCLFNSKNGIIVKLLWFHSEKRRKADTVLLAPTDK